MGAIVTVLGPTSVSNITSGEPLAEDEKFDLLPFFEQVPLNRFTKKTPTLDVQTGEMVDIEEEVVLSQNVLKLRLVCNPGNFWGDGSPCTASATTNLKVEYSDVGRVIK